jgi:L-asparagine oxygenase
MTTSTDQRIGTELRLTAEEARQVAELTRRLSERFPAAEDERLLQELPLLTDELPGRVRRYLRAFALDQGGGFCVVSGHLMDDDRIGPTPGHWNDAQRVHTELPEEILVLLYGALLGEPFGWATQQDGHLVNDVFPIRAYERELLGTGSRTPLTLHTEDAFHPYRADYIMLLSLRNPDRVPVTVAEADFTVLPDELLDVLFQPRFRVVPDKSHRPENNSVRTEEDRLVFENIARLIDGLRPMSVLTGSRSHPLLRFDATHLSAPPEDEEAVRALAAADRLLKENQTDCPLEPGMVAFLNNHRVVHSRTAFQARYDGSDRWLKRLNITQDLRKSRDMRRSVGSRLIG